MGRRLLNMVPLVVFFNNYRNTQKLFYFIKYFTKMKSQHIHTKNTEVKKAAFLFIELCIHIYIYDNMNEKTRPCRMIDDTKYIVVR